MRDEQCGCQRARAGARLHRYEVHLAGRQSGYAEVDVPGLPVLRTASPPEYDGPGDAWSPEHLLLAAVESC